MDKFDKNKQQAPSTPGDKNKYGTQQEQPKQDQSGKRADVNQPDRDKVTTPGQSHR